MKKSINAQEGSLTTRRTQTRPLQTQAEVQVRGLDLSTVGAGKPRGVKDASNDKIEVESM